MEREEELSGEYVRMWEVEERRETDTQARIKEGRRQKRYINKNKGRKKETRNYQMNT